MKIIFILFCCFLFGFDAAAQPANQNAEVAIEAIALARDDGTGKAGETTDKFSPNDRPIHCFIQLNSIKPATVKLILVAVKAAGLPAETPSIAVSYTTNGNQNQVNFNAAPETIWAAGSYRADIYINGKFAKSHLFAVEKSAAEETGAKKPPAPKALVSRRNTRKPRKN